MPVKVKPLSPTLKERFGDEMHVADRIAVDGEKRGLWEILPVEDKEIRPEQGKKGYEVKGLSLDDFRGIKR